MLDIQLEREEYLIQIYKIDEAISLLKSTINNDTNPKRKDENRENGYAQIDAYKIIDFIIERMNGDLIKCIQILENQKKYISLYYRNLPKHEPSFSKYSIYGSSSDPIIYLSINS